MESVHKMPFSYFLQKLASMGWIANSTAFFLRGCGVGVEGWGEHSQSIYVSYQVGEGKNKTNRIRLD